MHGATLSLWWVLAEQPSSPLPPGVTSTSTATVAIIGGASLLLCALVPELFKLLRRTVSSAGEGMVSMETMEAMLDSLRAELTAGAEARNSASRTIANGARAESRAVRKVCEERDRDLRESFQELRDELHRHTWGDHRPDPLVPLSDPATGG